MSYKKEDEIPIVFIHGEFSQCEDKSSSNKIAHQKEGGI